LEHPKILHLSTYDDFGGAARAAFRILESQIENGIDSMMLTLVKKSKHAHISTPVHSDIKIKLKLVHDYLDYYRNYSAEKNKNLFSDGNISAGLIDEINSSDCNIVHLHWISYMLSIEDIGKINKPVVWTLHDMWPFCGREHYMEENDLQIYMNNKIEVQNHNQNINVDTWKRKLKYWNSEKFSIVCPSKWLAELSKKSTLFKPSKTYVIPYPVDTNYWKPYLREAARRSLGLPLQKKLILFSAQNALSNKIKGWELLLISLKTFDKQYPNTSIELIIIGDEKNEEANSCPYKIHWLGKINDDNELLKIYASSDVAVVPSKMEAFSQVTVEAQSCGIPVIAFNVSGPSEIVLHKKTGWLAQPFDTNDFAEGIYWCIEDDSKWLQLSKEARAKTIERYSPPVIAEMYRVVYKNIMLNAT
jgi:glycosyltransferase involved in cell wall biosynthesis